MAITNPFYLLAKPSAFHFLDGLNDSVLNFDYNDKQKVNKSALLSYFL